MAKTTKKTQQPTTQYDVTTHDNVPWLLAEAYHDLAGIAAVLEFRGNDAGNIDQAMRQIGFELANRALTDTQPTQ